MIVAIYLFCVLLFYLGFHIYASGKSKQRGSKPLKLVGLSLMFPLPWIMAFPILVTLLDENASVFYWRYLWIGLVPLVFTLVLIGGLGFKNSAWKTRAISNKAK